MGSFSRAKESVENVQKQGCEVDSSIQKTFKTYEQQADYADRELLEKQKKEREEQ